ncbi:MAG: mannose-6-phosphate isomerase, class I, partial [Candidatus Omnitrophica bacterium]|nr:mannose-6-phosphate isomerase, class I [Candidatus Omnitrophota bacterium]
MGNTSDGELHSEILKKIKTMYKYIVTEKIMPKRIIKAVSLAVCIAFTFTTVLSDLAYAVPSAYQNLAVELVSQNPDQQSVVKAAASINYAKRYPNAVQLSECPESFILREGDVPAQVDGVRAFRADYDNIPPAWKEFSTTNEKGKRWEDFRKKYETYKRTNPSVPDELKDKELPEYFHQLEDAVTALMFFLECEAGISSEDVRVIEGYFPVTDEPEAKQPISRIEPLTDAEEGKLPIARIEPQDDGTYLLVVHTVYAQHWRDIRQKDVWFEQTLKGKKRTASYAWAINFWVCKHEAKELAKIPGVVKTGGHLSQTSDGVELDRDEEDVNNISGRLAEFNEAMRLAYMEGYCIDTPDIYFETGSIDRIMWVFGFDDDKTAVDEGIDKGFPLTRQKTEEEIKNTAHLAFLAHYYSLEGEDGKLRRPSAVTIPDEMKLAHEKRLDQNKKLDEISVEATGARSAGNDLAIELLDIEIDLMSSETEKVVGACKRIEKTGKKAAILIPHLVEILSDREADAESRLAAARSLGKMDSFAIAAVSLLAQVAKEEGERSDLGKQALAAEEHIKAKVRFMSVEPNKTIIECEKALGSSDPKRIAAACRKAELKGSSAAALIPLLMLILSNRDHKAEVRAAAARALGKMGPLALGALVMLEQVLDEGGRDNLLLEDCAASALQAIKRETCISCGVEELLGLKRPITEVRKRPAKRSTTARQDTLETEEISRILIVDGKTAHAELIQKYLQSFEGRTGRKITEIALAKSQEGAVQKASEASEKGLPFHLVITAGILPMMNTDAEQEIKNTTGVDILFAVRSVAGHKDAHVLLLTGNLLPAILLEYAKSSRRNVSPDIFSGYVHESDTLSSSLFDAIKKIGILGKKQSDASDKPEEDEDSDITMKQGTGEVPPAENALATELLNIEIDLRSGDTDRVISACEKTGQKRKQATILIPLLVNFLSDREADERIRLAACMALGRMGSYAIAAIPLFEQVAEEESEKGTDLEHIAHESAKNARKELLSRSGLNIDEIRGIGAALLGSDPEEQEGACKEAGENGKEAALLIPLLVNILSDEEGYMPARAAAARALGKMGILGVAALPLLEEMRGDEGKDKLLLNDFINLAIRAIRTEAYVRSGVGELLRSEDTIGEIAGMKSDDKDQDDRRSNLASMLVSKITVGPLSKELTFKDLFDALTGFNSILAGRGYKSFTAERIRSERSLAILALENYYRALEGKKPLENVPDSQIDRVLSEKIDLFHSGNFLEYRPYLIGIHQHTIDLFLELAGDNGWIKPVDLKAVKTVKLTAMEAAFFSKTQEAGNRDITSVYESFIRVLGSMNRTSTVLQETDDRKRHYAEKGAGVIRKELTDLLEGKVDVRTIEFSDDIAVDATTYFLIRGHRSERGITYINECFDQEEGRLRKESYIDQALLIAEETASYRLPHNLSVRLWRSLALYIYPDGSFGYGKETEIDNSRAETQLIEILEEIGKHYAKHVKERDKSPTTNFEGISGETVVQTAAKKHDLDEKAVSILVALGRDLEKHAEESKTRPEEWKSRLQEFKKDPVGYIRKIRPGIEEKIRMLDEEPRDYARKISALQLTLNPHLKDGLQQKLADIDYVLTQVGPARTDAAPGESPEDGIAMRQGTGETGISETPPADTALASATEPLVLPDEAQTANECARRIVDAVKADPNLVLGLATGGTQIPVYKRIIELTEAEGVDWSGVTTFNLDEYAGLDTTHDQSYRYYMNENLFNALSDKNRFGDKAIRIENTHVPDGMAEDLDKEMEAYAAMIRSAGGVDLWLLGMGSDGHYAFLEPAAVIDAKFMDNLKRGLFDGIDFSGSVGNFPLRDKIRDFNDFYFSDDTSSKEYEDIKEAIFGILGFQAQARNSLGNFQDLVDTYIRSMAREGKTITQDEAKEHLDKLGGRMQKETERTFYVPLSREQIQRLQRDLEANGCRNIKISPQKEYFGKPAKVVNLAVPTLIGNARNFNNINEVPLKALTAVGIVMESKALLQHIIHKSIAPALRDTLTLPEPTPECPSSILRTHDNWKVVCTADAAHLLGDTLGIVYEKVAAAIASRAYKKNPTPLKIHCETKHYDWGDPDFLPALLRIDNSGGKPYAELWIGAHPSAPAKADVTDIEVNLNDLIEGAAEEILGKEAADSFKAQLPYLLKILTAATALSIQAHPDRRQAEEGWAREAAARKKGEEVSYSDSNHKPEIICAVTKSWALNGFRPIDQIVEDLRGLNVPDLGEEVRTFIDEVTQADGDAEENKKALKKFYSGLMERVKTLKEVQAPLDQELDGMVEAAIAGRSVSDDEKKALREKLKAEQDRIAEVAPQARISNIISYVIAKIKMKLYAELEKPAISNTQDFVAAAEEQGRTMDLKRELWALRLNDQYPNDMGVLSVYLLNLVRLEPGQAMYLPAGELHAYLGKLDPNVKDEGAGIELMANSDNVLRGGLTPKRIDVPELLNTLTFTYGEPKILVSETKTAAEGVYRTDADEFQLSVINVNEEQTFTSDDAHSADMLIVMEGSATLTDSGGNTLELEKGDTIMIPAVSGQYTITTGETAKLYKASVPGIPMIMQPRPQDAKEAQKEGTAMKQGTEGLSTEEQEYRSRTTFEEAFEGHADKQKLKKIYDRIAGRILEVCGEFEERYGEEAFTTPQPSVIPGGSNGDTLLVKIFLQRKVREVCIYRPFIENIYRLSKLSDKADDVIDLIIDSAVFHEIGHGFEGYSGLDYISLIKDPAMRQVYADILGLKEGVPEEGKLQFVESIADLNMGGPGNIAYVMRKAAYLFYKFISSSPDSYIGRNGRVNAGAVTGVVEGYFRDYKYLRHAIVAGVNPENQKTLWKDEEEQGSEGAEVAGVDKVIQDMAREVIRMTGMFFGFAPQTTTATAQIGAIVLSWIAGKPHTVGTAMKQGLGEKGPRSAGKITYRRKSERKSNERIAELDAAKKIQLRIEALLSEIELIDSDYKKAKTGPEKEDLKRRERDLLHEMAFLYRNISFDISEGKLYGYYSDYLKQSRKERDGEKKDGSDGLYGKMEAASAAKDIKKLQRLNIKAIRLNKRLIKLQLKIAGMLLMGRSGLTSKASERSAARSTLLGGLDTAFLLTEELRYRIARLHGGKKIREFDTTDWTGTMIRTSNIKGFDIEVLRPEKKGDKPRILVRQSRWINVHTTLIDIRRDVKRGDIEKAIKKLDMLEKIYSVRYIRALEFYRDISKDLRALRDILKAPPSDKQIEEISAGIKVLIPAIRYPKQ